MRTIYSKTALITFLFLMLSFPDAMLYSQLQQEWVRWYNGSSNMDDTADAIVCDTAGNIYAAGNVIVTGESGNISSGYDIATVKYGIPTGIPNSNQKTIFEFYLHQNYPNPFNPVTKIKFDVPGESGLSGEGTHEVKLTIYDVNGRESVTLISRRLQPGTYEVEWNAIDFPSGIYFSKLTYGNFSETRRMVLVK